jgi:hypothetical protein
MIKKIDEYVLRMVKDAREPHAKLIKLVRFYCDKEASNTAVNRSNALNRINVIHSLMGAIRNFCVAGILLLIINNNIQK